MNDAEKENNILSQTKHAAVCYGFAIGEISRYNFSDDSADILHTVGISYVMSHISCSMVTAITPWNAVGQGLETAIWQSLASCYLPTVVTCWICSWAYDYLTRYCEEDNQSVRTWGTIMTGLFTIPIYTFTIDPAVGYFLQIFNPLLIFAGAQFVIEE